MGIIWNDGWLHFLRNNYSLHSFQRQLELFRAGTPVSWKKKLSQIKFLRFLWNFFSWNTSQLELFLDIDSNPKRSYFWFKNFLFDRSSKNSSTLTRKLRYMYTFKMWLKFLNRIKLSKIKNSHILCSISRWHNSKNAYMSWPTKSQL